jgi:anti-sigma factor RsiW
MNCSRQWIDAYVDDELDASVRWEVEQHLAGCEACAGLRTQIAARREQIRAAAPYYRAPERLRQSVHAALRAEAAGPRRWPWLAVAATVLLAVGVVWGVRRGGERDLLAQEIVASHVRSTIGGRLVDVPSSDRHTVRPWFNGKLDFSPEVKDLAAEGFPLSGGRVDYVGGRTVAVLVYRSGNHDIDLYLWPAGTGGDSETQRNGFTILHWTEGGMTAWAISDVAREELLRFRDAQMADFSKKQ